MIFLIFVGIFSAAYYAGSESNVSDEDAKSFLKEFDKMVEGIDAIGIFAHNASVAIPMFIPGAGIIWGSFAAWSTGVAFKALVTTTPELSQFPPLALLYLSPFGAMELVAYSIAMSRSFLLVNTIIKKKSLRAEIRPVIIEVSMVIAILLAAGFIEYTMLHEFGSNISKLQP